MTASVYARAQLTQCHQVLRGDRRARAALTKCDRERGIHHALTVGVGIRRTAAGIGIGSAAPATYM
jgi:hypothetical protein